MESPRYFQCKSPTESLEFTSPKTKARLSDLEADKSALKEGLKVVIKKRDELYDKCVVLEGKVAKHDKTLRDKDRLIHALK